MVHHWHQGLSLPLSLSPLSSHLSLAHNSQLLPGDHELHQVFTRFNERPFVLLFDTASKPDQRELPVAFFEEVTLLRASVAGSAH